MALREPGNCGVWVRMGIFTHFCLRSIRYEGRTSVVPRNRKSFFDFLIFNFYDFLGLSIPATATVTEDPDEDFDEDDDSTEADDDGRIYKNPRNHPSLDCPRDEEQATLLGEFFNPS